MDPVELARKMDRVNEVFEAGTQSGYRGASDAHEISAYIERIHAALSDVIFDGFKGERDGAKELEILKNGAMRSYRLNQQEYMHNLESGRVYDEMAETLLKVRLRKELGDDYRYSNRLLRININEEVKVNVDSLAYAGYADDAHEQYMFFNPLGVVLLSKELKEAALSHEAAHILLGHADRNFRLPHDRTKLELDANYVGALIHRDTQAYNALNHFSRDWQEAKTIAKEWDRSEKKSRLYQRAGKTPGQDKKLDSRIERDVGEDRFHQTYASGITYPTIDEKIAVVDDLQREISAGLIENLTRQNLLKKALKERGVQTGRPR